MTTDSEPSPAFIPKRVDESWKDSVRKEKETTAQKPPVESPPAEESEFLTFLSTLAMQTLMALGEIPNPATGRAQADAAQAQYLIDVLQMLSDKTKGNLSEVETSEMKTILYQLRLKFVQKSQEAAT